jgi:hypothetical protein
MFARSCRFGNGLAIVKISPALAQQEQVLVRLGAAVGYALGHRVRLRPDDVLAQIPAIGL